ncbi:hypothetical protein EL17_18770 [Anditalea andensis]|uniref:DUF2971 domain-containing protein n=1 Tax=Anditalea andensis TaxID=1048983 RepID=A0A074KVI2_9BACT|nr:hypothetical protein EL17_18770 [Anditalea andensis]
MKHFTYAIAAKKEEEANDNLNRMVKKKKIWQRKYIKEVFDSSSNKKKYYAKIVLKNLHLIEKKNEYLPKYLFKYYSPTSDNILDFQNQKLWLSHPTFFNDPFDCNIGYDSEKYEKNRFLKFIEDSGCVDKDIRNGFSLEDKQRVQRCYLGETNYWTTKYESYYDVKRKLFESKSKEFRDKVDTYLRDQLAQIDLKIQKLKNINIRVACFSELNKYEEFHNQILMWSHYADNHKGFCVEYDLEPLKNEIDFTLKDYDFYNDKEKYLDERNIAIIKAGLFPVEYTSNRVNIPVTKLNQIEFDDKGRVNYNSNIDELIYKTIIVKSSNWSYEKEWRIIIDEKVSNYYNNKIPFPFAKTIFLGCKASNELIETMIKIGKEINVEVLLMKTNGKKFGLDSIRTWSYDFDNERRQWKNPYVF